jgi:hypothetical protein
MHAVFVVILLCTGKRDAMNSDHFSKNRQRTIPLKNLEKGRPKLTVVRTKNQLASRKA